MKLTGERPMEGATPDSLLALHDAGYREVIARIGEGRVLDVGCGVGTETARFCGPGRQVVGVDYSAETAVLAGKEFGPGGPRGAAATFTAMDGARLGFAGASFNWVCSSHIIEHFTGPETHAAELARVTKDDGSAFVITPNRPADFENPFHVYLFEAAELASLLRLFFEDVEVLGLEGDDVLKADFAARRSSGEKLLKLDVFDLRRRLPRAWHVWSYEHALPLVYRMLGSKSTGIGSGLDDSHFFITDEIRDTTPVLFAIARRPRRFPEH
ncbi:MAG: class I SAM-dependent methyltransferase [Actinobacteria bacterium]|nr:class I SAM-dependent methyltransferase [Actinomycetota bacterium]